MLVKVTGQIGRLGGKWATFPDWELIETRQVTEDFGFLDAAIRVGQGSW